jgi:DNA-binding helix-turn-helix protein
MGSRRLRVGPLQREAVALVREVMSREGVSGRAVADRAGVTATRCAAILRNERPATVDELAAITEALGVPASLVVSRAEERLVREASPMGGP